MKNDYFQCTVECLKPDPDRKGYFLLTEPHLLYMSEDQAGSYLKAMENPDYTSSFHNPTVKIIESNLPEIFRDFGKGVSLIDLGPGYPDKSMPIAKYLRQRGIPCKYVPVDISSSFLEIAKKSIAPIAEQVYPIHDRFETCLEQIPSEVYQYTTYCMIGLTFMNFVPEHILILLKDIARDQGRVIIASELITKQNTTEKIINSYRARETKLVGFGPLQHLGLNIDELAYNPVFSNGRVELQFQLKAKPGDILQRLGVKEGNTIITAVSYRYTKDEINALMGRYFKRHHTFLSMDGATALAVGEQ